MLVWTYSRRTLYLSQVQVVVWHVVYAYMDRANGQAGEMYHSDTLVQVQVLNVIILDLSFVTMNAPDPDPNPNPGAPAPPPHEPEAKKRNLTSEERRAIVSTLQLSIKPDDPEMKLERGAIKSAAEVYHVDRLTIRRIWQRALANYHDPNVRAFVASPQRKGKCGRRLKWSRDQVREAVRLIESDPQKRTIRSLAAELKIPKSTLFRMKQENVVTMPGTSTTK